MHSSSNRRGGLRTAVMGAFAAVMIAVSMLVPGLGTSPAQAANITDGFNPGNIVSDANFYDGRALEPTQVQTFLNQRVPRCTIGDPGRQAGMAWGNTRIASKCLKNFTMNTQSRPANAYCAAYAGRTGESAAQIITKVGQACGISQRVLLIMLEKEQSLVTDTWPTVRQFDVAMGYACPDSGPGNSANCDPSQTGFYQQVYRAAWQLKVYRANPNSYNYKPFQNNRIQWHPNAGCGTSNVYISNWATAALYIYTPYRPNQAALNAGWGTGDSCSSYGNRNFHNFYKTWFGDPRGVSVAPELLGYYASNGRMGTPSRNAVRITGNGGGVIQDFSGGRITYSNSVKRAHGLTKGPFLSAYLANGGPAGSWGWLSSDASCGLRDSGCTVSFQNGTGVYSKNTGARFTPTRVWNFWVSQGREGGVLGYPIASAQQSGATAFQEFQNGGIIVSPAGDYRLGSELTAAFKNPGGGLPGLGHIVNPTQRVSAQRYFVEFEKATLYVDSRGKDLRLGNGPFLDAYRKAGGATGAWGWPLSPAVCGLTGGGCTMEFEGGTAVYSPSTGVSLLNGEQRQNWRDRGAQDGDLGYPFGTTQLHGAGSAQEYQKAILFVGPQASVRFGRGPFLDAYLAAGGPQGSWGWPAAAAVCGLPEGGCTMRFDSGTAVYSAETGVAFITAAAQLQAWRSTGGGGGSLGFPVGVTEHYRQGSVQEYQKAFFIIGPQHSVRLGRGPFFDAFRAAGGPEGRWGWPAAPAVCGLADGGCTMAFQNGTATFTASGGVVFR